MHIISNMLKERVKPVVLGLVLAFIAGSYFRSDVFKRGEMARYVLPISHGRKTS